MDRELMWRVTDLRRINSQAVDAKNSGVIILGGGLVKHHICNANLMVCTSRLVLIDGNDR